MRKEIFSFSGRDQESCDLSGEEGVKQHTYSLCAYLNTTHTCFQSHAMHCFQILVLLQFFGISVWRRGYQQVVTKCDFIENTTESKKRWRTWTQPIAEVYDSKAAPDEIAKDGITSRPHRTSRTVPKHQRTRVESEAFSLEPPWGLKCQQNGIFSRWRKPMASLEQPKEISEESGDIEHHIRPVHI